MLLYVADLVPVTANWPLPLKSAKKDWSMELRCAIMHQKSHNKTFFIWKQIFPKN